MPNTSAISSSSSWWLWIRYSEWHECHIFITAIVCICVFQSKIKILISVGRWDTGHDHQVRSGNFGSPPSRWLFQPRWHWMRRSSRSMHTRHPRWWHTLCMRPDDHNNVDLLISKKREKQEKQEIESSRHLFWWNSKWVLWFLKMFCMH